MAVAVNGLKMYLLLSKLSVMLSQVWHVENEECVIQMEVSINIRVAALGPARARSILSVKSPGTNIQWLLQNDLRKG